VVIKRGGDGAGALDPEVGYIERQSLPVTVASAVGAGDAFNAGYIYARQQLWDVALALRVAIFCGAAVCRGTGDVETFPHRRELDAYLSRSAS
jgi:2-dehydro-3-deoxygluconokinase